MYAVIKRTSDFVSAFLVLLIGFPFFLIVGVWIALESRGGVFYRQERIGKNGKPFGLFKFRSMRKNADKNSRITVGNRDPRITKSGRWIRKFKIDEFPQLINVIKGEMSVVGPRPEVKEYVDLYTDEQRKVLSVTPGLTDYASIEYINENELLAASDDPQKTYIEEVMPAKLELNMQYIKDQSFVTDLKVIFKTIGKIFR